VPGSVGVGTILGTVPLKKLFVHTQNENGMVRVHWADFEAWVASRAVTPHAMVS
jgi:hypothetical protein